MRHKAVCLCHCNGATIEVEVLLDSEDFILWGATRRFDTGHSAMDSRDFASAGYPFPAPLAHLPVAAQALLTQLAVFTAVPG